LQKLSLSKCVQLTSLSLVLVTSRYNCLQELNISHLNLLTDDALSAIALNCHRNLLVLNASECLQLSDPGLVDIATHCSNLRELYLGTNVSQTDAWGGRVTQYSDRSLEAIMRKCRKLIVLDLRNQCGLTLTSPFFKSAKPQTKKKSGEGRFTGHVSLQHLNLLGCDKVSRQSLARMLSKCFALNHVILPRGPVAATGVPLASLDLEDDHSFPLLPPPAGEEDDIPDQSFESFNEEISVSLSLRSTTHRSVNSKKTSISATPASSVSPSVAPSAVASQGQGRKKIVSSKSSISSATSPSSALTKKEWREQQRAQQLFHSKRQFWYTAFRYTCYTTPSPPSSSPGDLRKWDGLFPHPLIATWAYRDAYLRRRLDELWACRKIQSFYRFTLSYRHLKELNTLKYLQRWFRHFRRLKQLQEIKDRLYVISCAILIQRNYRKNLLPLIRNALKIQKIVRGWRGRVLTKKLLKKHKAAQAIQKMARGMIIRLSDRHLLTQIYLKLPPFWKIVIHSCAPEEGGSGGGGASGLMSQFGKFVIQQSYSEVTKHHHILKSTRDVRAMIAGIESNRQVPHDITTKTTSEKIFNLAPKLPFIVPQSFDKTPYVSRADGRKLAFFSEQSALLKKDLDAQDNKAFTQSLYASKSALTYGLENLQAKGLERDVHQYTFTFWPVVSRPPMESAGDTSLFDPMLNGFDVRQNLNETLHCELCGIRLRLIFCHICCKGFCFFCAFKAHLDGTKRSHKMDMMEPRVVQVKEADKSLIYHLDMVQKTTYDIKSVVTPTIPSLAPPLPHDTLTLPPSLLLSSPATGTS
jgi:hypothetical protein